jgi:SH3-like domain-containing protein
MSSRPIQFLILPLIVLAGCSRGPARAPVIGEAFVGPAVLNLRRDLAPSSEKVAMVKHGERVEVIQTRRRFILVRTAGGAEGWTDNRQLLDAAQLATIRDMAVRATRLPSRGKAAATTQLNMHAEAARTSPNIYQLQEKAQVEVVARKVVARATQPTVGPLVIARPKPPVRRKKESSDSAKAKVPPPPMPAAPKPPGDWQKMSRVAAVPVEKVPDEEAEPPKPVPLDDWSLVVTSDGNAGWVLSGMLSMAIPDEVAQYSEGARITSYYKLGQAEDEGKTHNHWLWTTLSQRNAPFDFDAYRVFIWSIRHHRYETAFVERHIEGVLPAAVHQIEVPNGKTTAKVQGFTVMLRREDGKLDRKTFWFEPYKVRLVDEAVVEMPGDPMEAEPTTPGRSAPVEQIANEQKPNAASGGGQSWWKRVRHLLSSN